MTATDSVPARWPAEDGFRWPAEWEPHEATWLCWPHNRETWPRQLPAVEKAFAAMVRALCESEKVCIGVQDAGMGDRVREFLTREGVARDANLACHVIPTNDAWVRDHGPVVLVRDSEGNRDRAAMDFGFNAWGAKYPPWDRDEDVARRISEILGLPRYATAAVLEAGSIEGNGEGLLLTTESCLLNANRGAGRTREGLESLLAQSLGAHDIWWLDAEIAGDDTDGHIDNLARFAAPNVVAVAVETDPRDPNHGPLQKNLAQLKSRRPLGRQGLSVVPLPMPPPVIVDGVRCPASYANFYIANTRVLMPLFDAPTDERAGAVLAELFPDREVVGIPSRDLVVGLGSLHCLTQQEPSRDPPGSASPSNSKRG